MSTPPTAEKLPKRNLKSEPRLSTIRKSLKRKSKKENHHELSMKQGTQKPQKTGSVLQVFDRSNWTENLSNLNSSSLEKVFLPNMTQKKKQEKDLHEENEDQTTSDQEDDSSERTLISSVCSVSLHDIESKSKPPIPNKKRKMSEQSKGISPSNSLLSEKSSSGIEGKTIRGEKLFSWLIAPVKADQFFRFVYSQKLHNSCVYVFKVRKFTYSLFRLNY